MRYIFIFLFFGILTECFADDPLFFGKGRGESSLVSGGASMELLSGESGNAFFVPFFLDFRNIEISRKQWLSFYGHFASKNNSFGRVFYQDDHEYEASLFGGTFYLPKTEGNVICFGAQLGHLFDTRDQNIELSFGGVFQTQKIYQSYVFEGEKSEWQMNFDLGPYGILLWRPFDDFVTELETHLYLRIHSFDGFSFAHYQNLNLKYNISPYIQDYIDFMGTDSRVLSFFGIRYNSTRLIDDPIGLWSFSLGVQVQFHIDDSTF